jgi:GNAT superfamily N-acetyltransferase
MRARRDIVMSGVTVRAATLDDEPLLQELAARLGEFQVPSWRRPAEIASADFRAMRAAVMAGNPQDQVLIAERDDAAIGCLHILATRDFFGRPHAHVSVVAITADAQGTGAGRALLDYAERWTRERGLGLLTLNVFAGNTRARRVYEKAGFVPEILKYAKEV